MEKSQNKTRLFFWHFVLWIFLIIAMTLAYGVYFVNITSTKSKWVILFSGAVALLYSSCKILEMSFYKNDSKEISDEIKNLLKTVLKFFGFKTIICLSGAILASALLYYFVGLSYALCFISGFLVILFSALCTQLVISRTSVLAREFSTNSLNSSYRLAFSSSNACSFLCIGLGACVLVILFHIFKDYQAVSSCAFGMIFCLFFENAAHIISKTSTKLAKTEINGEFNSIEELNNNCLSIVKIPLKYTALLISALIFAMAMGSYILNLMGLFLPLIIAANGIFVSIIAGLLIKINKNKNPRAMLYRVVFLAVALFCLVTYLTITFWLPDYAILAYNTIAGAILAYILIFTRKNRAQKYKSTQNVINAPKNVFAISFQTLVEGIENTFVPVLIVAFCLVLTFKYCEGVQFPYLGLYSNSLFVLSLVSLSPILAAVHSFCFIEKNNRPADIELNAYDVSHSFDNYYNIALVLVCFIMLIVFSIETRIEQADILNPYVMFALISGGATPFLWLAMLMRAILKISNSIKKEGLLQFKVIQKTSLGSAFCSLLAFILPMFCVLMCGIILKSEVLAGYLTGVILSTCGIIICSLNCSYIINSALNLLSALKKDDCCAEIKTAANVFEIFDEIIRPFLADFAKISLIAAFSLCTLFIG